MRRSGIFLFLFLFTLPLFLGAQTDRLHQFSSQLNAISDSSLRRTLQNSIIVGLIENQHDFDLAVSQAEAAANYNNPVGFSAYRSRGDAGEEIRRLTAPIHNLDRDALKVAKNPKYKTGENYLFVDMSSTLPRSYVKAVELCSMFNPKNGTNDAKRLNDEIDAFLDSIKKDPVIVHALSCTGTTLEDLKKNWFGSGLGFEHVVAGELNGKKVSGYHWWYKFYHDERAGNTQIRAVSGDVGNPKAFTGSFHWDPDGEDGPLPKGYKSIGGFSIGNSVQAVLALGHIAMEVSRKHGSIPGAMRFRANINGAESYWQLYTMNGNIRSLYPIKNTKTQSIDEYYELEGELVESDYRNETLH